MCELCYKDEIRRAYKEVMKTYMGKHPCHITSLVALIVLLDNQGDDHDQNK